MKKILLSFVLILVSYTFVNAQTALVPYKWDAYGLKFQVPENSDILESSETRFVVDNPNLKVEIEAYDGPALGSDDLSNIVIQLAENEGIVYDESTEVQQFANSGLQGMSIEGDRSGDGIAVAMLLSERSNNVVAVKVIYGHGLENVANDIINSFTMTK